MIISKFLKLKQINMQDLSKLCGINVATLYAIARGYQPTPKLARKLIRYSKGLITVQDLYRPLFRLQESLSEQGYSDIQQEMDVLKQEYISHLNGHTLDKSIYDGFEMQIE